MYRILALDGGGVKSYLTLEILKELEKKSGKKIYEMFDLVVGTSGGALIAALLDTLPAAYIQHLFRNTYRKRLFSPNKNSFNGLLKPKYNIKDKEYAIKQLLQSKTEFKNFDFAAISYDIFTNTPIIFNTIEEECYEDYILLKDFTVVDSILASSAAPVYWSPHEYKNMTLVDGALCANNPTNVGVKLALNKNIKLEDIGIVRIGTGHLTRDYSFNTKSYNIFKWLLPLFNITMNAPSDITHMLYSNEGLHYYSLNGPLKFASDNIDDVSNFNFNNLKLDADNIIIKNTDKIETILSTFT